MKIVLFLKLLFISLISVAQHYVISPSKQVTMMSEFNALTITDVYQTNISKDTIHLKWKLISNELHPGWDFSLCDYTTCYPGIPNEGTMTPVPPDEKGFLGLNVNPYDIVGTGVVKIFVYEDGFIAKGDTITWFVNATATGINEIARTVTISLYPNPANEMVTLQLDALNLSAASIQVADLLGKVLINKPITSTLIKLDVADLPNGYYLIRCSCENETVGMKKLCVAK